MNKGECAGTCPLCEKELLDLIQFISKRSFQTYYRDALSWGNWWLSRGKFLTLQLNPAMRGASEEEHTGCWVVRLHTERRLLTLYFLAIRNLRNFEFATKDEAIVDAPWVRLCASYYGIAGVSGFFRWAEGRCQEYSVASLNMKNLMSPTPRNWVLNALILALKDSADALVSLRSK